MLETKQDQNKPYQHYQKDNYPNTGADQMNRALQNPKKVEKK